MSKKFIFHSFIFILMSMALTACVSEPSSQLRAGLRASGYGIRPFPQPEWWRESANSMAVDFNEVTPTLIWIVGTVQRGGSCWLTFPIPDGANKSEYENIMFALTDRNETYLDLFDESGVQVWLQVEPGAADIETLLELVMGQYATHPSVIGFGVDVEWYLNEEYHEGKAISDAEIEAWVARVRDYDQDYQVFLKHWLQEKMPATYRDGVMFLDDSQGFASIDQMVDEFIGWGKAFDPAPVGFQFGYPADRFWWEQFSDPPAEIGMRLLENIPNAVELYWVDFTAEEIWPNELP